MGEDDMTDAVARLRRLLSELGDRLRGPNRDERTRGRRLAEIGSVLGVVAVMAVLVGATVALRPTSSDTPEQSGPGLPAPNEMLDDTTTAGPQPSTTTTTAVPGPSATSYPTRYPGRTPASSTPTPSPGTPTLPPPATSSAATPTRTPPAVTSPPPTTPVVTPSTPAPTTTTETPTDPPPPPVDPEP